MAHSESKQGERQSPTLNSLGSQNSWCGVQALKPGLENLSFAKKPKTSLRPPPSEN
jgi:hypothetical protein